MQAKLAGYKMSYFANLVNYEKNVKCQHQHVYIEIILCNLGQHKCSQQGLWWSPFSLCICFQSTFLSSCRSSARHPQIWSCSSCFPACRWYSPDKCTLQRRFWKGSCWRPHLIWWETDRTQSDQYTTYWLISESVTFRY